MPYPVIFQGEFFAFLAAVLLFFAIYPQEAAFALQQNGYKKCDTYRKNRFPGDVKCALICIGVTAGLSAAGGRTYDELAGLVLVSMAFSVYRLCRKRKATKKFTPRQFRLAVLRVLLGAVFTVPLFYTVFYGVGFLANHMGIYRFTPVVLSALCLTAEPIALLSHFLSLPGERKIAQKYLKKAEKKLDGSPQTLRIAITGSFGKTTVKTMLNTILSEKYTVFATPASYNTPMGIARAINEGFRNELVFIAEAGARKPGEIAELCDIVRPEIGILTAVGKQHIASFGSLSKIVKTKGELCEAVLRAGGAMFFGGDNVLSRKMYADYGGEKILCGSTANTAPVEIGLESEDESGMTVRLKKGDVSQKTRLFLYGRHALSDFCIAAAVADHLGLSLQEIAAGAEKVRPVPHRLQVIKYPFVTVIDDSFNGNKTGATEALRVAAVFQKRVVVVTPGLVELGEEAFAENRDLGLAMSKVAAAVLITARENERALRFGLADGKFQGKIVAADNGDSIEKLLAPLRKPNDVVVFLNDLPDFYK